MARYSNHRRKKDRSGQLDSGEHWISCACGKRGYSSRKGARAALRAVRTANERRGVEPISATAALREYLCDTGSWHIGHRTHRGANLNDPRLSFVPTVIVERRVS